jgi:hypothetical protein
VKGLANPIETIDRPSEYRLAVAIELGILAGRAYVGHPAGLVIETSLLALIASSRVDHNLAAAGITVRPCECRSRTCKLVYRDGEQT